MKFLLPAPYFALVLRTDFSDDPAWETLQATLEGEPDYGLVTFVSDPAFAGTTARQAPAVVEGVGEVFLADAEALSGGEFALLAVDLSTEPGRAFRVTPRAFVEVTANFMTDNMEFAFYADAADRVGVFRGFA